MSERLQKVEQMIRREIAALLLRGEMRDPRVQPIAAISITGVRVSADLGSARVFIDGLDDAVDFPRVLAGLNAGAGAMRAALGSKIALKHTPRLRFERDQSVERGRAIERVLSELASERVAEPTVPDDDADEAAAGPDDVREDVPSAADP